MRARDASKRGDRAGKRISLGRTLGFLIVGLIVIRTA
jgi:hypothetical protein